jgi:hypothetical protein
MNRKRATSWRRAPGVSLIEAVAGTVLLATLLVSILQVQGRLKVQSRAVAQRGEACEAIDELLRGWWPDLPSLPREGAGEVPGRAGWQWQTRTVARQDAAAVDGQVVQVDVFAPQWSGPAPTGRIEILLPAPEAP